MTNEKLVDTLKLIKDLYPATGPNISERVIVFWGKCFKEYSDDVVDKALAEALKENKYAPTINEIVTKCEEAVVEHNRLLRYLNNIYFEIIDLYPRDAKNSQNAEAYCSFVQKEEEAKWLERAIRVKKRFYDFYYERNENEPLPDFTEWLYEDEEVMK